MKSSPSRSRRVTHNTFLLFVTESAAMLFSWVAAGYLTRHWMGVGTYGQYALIVNWVAIFATFSDLGLNALTIREVAYRKQTANFYLRNVMALRVFFSVLFMTALFVIGFSLHYEPILRLGLLVMGMRLVMDCASGGYVYLLQANERMGVHGSIVLVASVLRCAGIVGVVQAGGGIVEACAVWTFVSAATLVVLAVLGAKQKWIPNFKGWKYQETIGVLKKAIPLATFSSLFVLYYRVDVVILKSLSGNEAVGYYDPANKVMGAVLLLSQRFGLALLPVLSSLQANKDLFGRVALRAIKAMVMLGVPMTIGGILLAQRLLILLFGAQYGFSGDLFAILGLSIVPLFFSVLTVDILIVKKPKFLNILFGVLFILNAVFNFVLIPILGAKGAAWATVTCEVIGLFWGLNLIWPYLKTRKGVPVLKPFFACLAASALMGALIFLDSRLYWLVLGPMVYGIGLILFKALDEEDWTSLRSVFKKS